MREIKPDSIEGAEAATQFRATRYRGKPEFRAVDGMEDFVAGAGGCYGRDVAGTCAGVFLC